MATATKSAKPARKPAPKRKPKTTLDYLQHALDDLDKARSQSQQEARASIDSAVGRIRDAATELRARASEPAREIEARLEQVSEEARREVGRMVINAQRSPEALNELASEIRRRKQALSA